MNLHNREQDLAPLPSSFFNLKFFYFASRKKSLKNISSLFGHEFLCKFCLQAFFI